MTLPAWRDERLAGVWGDIRRRRNSSALEIERANKRIGSSLEVAPAIYISDPELLRTIAMELAGDRGEAGMAEIAITSAPPSNLPKAGERISPR